MNAPVRIYVHCPDAKCGCHREALGFLRSWKLKPSFGHDGNHYLTFVIPADWPQVRINRFTDALNRHIVAKQPDALGDNAHDISGQRGLGPNTMVRKDSKQQSGQSQIRISDLYEALIHVSIGDLSADDILDAYIRATCVAAGVGYDPTFMEELTRMLHDQRMKPNTENTNGDRGCLGVPSPEPQ